MVTHPDVSQEYKGGDVLHHCSRHQVLIGSSHFGRVQRCTWPTVDVRTVSRHLADTPHTYAVCMPLGARWHDMNKQSTSQRSMSVVLQEHGLVSMSSVNATIHV